MAWRTCIGLGFLLLMAAAVLVGTAPSEAADETAPQVVVSLKPIHSLVAGVMAGRGQPRLLVQGAGSPHSYSLRPSEARALREADLVFWIDPGMESFLVRPLNSLAGAAEVVTLSQAPGLTLLPRREGGAWGAEGDHGHDHGHDLHDAPTNLHLWLAPQNAEHMVEAIVAALARADPGHEQLYRANGAALTARLDALDRELGGQLAPFDGVPYLVFHDAYPYFEQRYGLEAVGALAISPEQQPGARRVAQIRQLIQDSGVRCLFAEPQFEPALARSLVEGTQARLGTLDPLGSAHPAGPEAYFAAMRDLASSLADCLAPNA